MAREGILDHHRLESCLAGVLFLGLFVYLWKGIEPHLLYSGFGVFTAYPVVSWEGSFWSATFRTPGGPVRTLAALLAQSYSRSWLGALTVAILLGVLWLGIRHLLRCGRAGRFRDLAWVPLLLALMIYSDYYEDPLPVLLAVGLAIWTAILYERMSEKAVPRGMGLGSPTQNSALGGRFQPMNHRQDADATKARGRAGLFLALLGALYYLAGAAALVFAAIACLTEAFLHRRIVGVLVQMVLAVGGLFVLGRFVFGLEPQAIYAAGTPWDADRPLNFFPVANWLALGLHFFVPGLILVALMGEALLAVDARRSTRRGRRREGRQPERVCEQPVQRGMGLGSPTQNSALGGPFQPMNHRQDADATKLHRQDARATFHTPSEHDARQACGRPAGSWAWVGLRMFGVAVTLVLCLAVARTQAHDERALHYYAQRRDWDRVLALAHRMRGKHQFTRSGVFDINRALAHTGRLGSELFAFPQDDLKTLYMRFDDMSGRLTRAKSLELYLDLGCLNAAQENAYELLAHEGPSPPVLDALVRIHLAKGQYETARVFLQALRKYAGCRQYVRRWQPIVADPARAEADPLLASWRRAKPTRDDTSLGISPVALRSMLEDKPDHRLAFEYLMACMLLRNERVELIRRLPLLKPLGYTQLPRHYAEAVLVQSLKTGRPAEASGWTIDPDVQRQFGEIRRIVTESRGNDQMLFDTLAPQYGDTYMFYSMFNLCGLK